MVPSKEERLFGQGYSGSCVLLDPQIRERSVLVGRGEFGMKGRDARMKKSTWEIWVGHPRE